MVLSLKEPANVMATIKQTANRMALSDPDSASYGQSLTSSQIAELVAPATEDVDIVTSWLTEAGVSFTVQGSHIVCSMATTASQAEQLFTTYFSTLVHRASGRSVVRAGGYRLPGHIEERAQAAFGLHGLPLPLRSRSAPPNGPRCRPSQPT